MSETKLTDCVMVGGFKNGWVYAINPTVTEMVFESIASDGKPYMRFVYQRVMHDNIGENKFVFVRSEKVLA